MTTQTRSSSQPAVGRETWRPSLTTALAAVPNRLRVVVGLAVAIAALLAAGVPLSTFVPFAGLAACLGMHLFMGHGHGRSPSNERPPEPDHGTGPVELRALDR